MTAIEARVTIPTDHCLHLDIVVPREVPSGEAMITRNYSGVLTGTGIARAFSPFKPPDPKTWGFAPGYDIPRLWRLKAGER